MNKELKLLIECLVVSTIVFNDMETKNLQDNNEQKLEVFKM